MQPLLIILATTAALLFGTGSLNFACGCDAGACGVETIDAAPARDDSSGCAGDHGGCCCSPEAEEPKPSQRTLPGRGGEAPGKCPCLYWTEAPLTNPDFSTGVVLVKRLLGASPDLLLEAAVLPQGRAAAATIRDGPRGPRDLSVRLQAWHCVWTI